MSPAPAALFRPSGMTLPYGRSPDKEPPLQLADFIYWVGRKCLCGASDSFFSAILTATCLKTTKQGSGYFGKNFIKVHQQLEFLRRCFKGKAFNYIKMKQIPISASLLFSYGF